MRIVEASIVAAIGESYVYVMLAWAIVGDVEMSTDNMVIFDPRTSSEWRDAGYGVSMRLGVYHGANRTRVSLS